MLGSAEKEHAGYLTVKLFLKNSKLCDHDQRYGRTDRQTDRPLAVAIPCSA